MFVRQNVAWLPKPNRVEVIPTGRMPPVPLITSAFVLGFDARGRILLADVKKRGHDVPGGHIEPGEGPREAAIREMREETGARVDGLRVAGWQRLSVDARHVPEDYRYPVPDSYQLFYTGLVTAAGPVLMPSEVNAPVWIEAGDVDTHPALAPLLPIVQAARTGLRLPRPASIHRPRQAARAKF